MNYRYDHFRREHLREALAFQSGRDPGWPAPDFDLPTAQGGRARRVEHLGRPLLVCFASLTDPVAAGAAPALKRLHREHGGDVAFLTVYVREAHPGDRIRQPATADWKLRHARMYQERDAIPWPVAVDDLEGTFHRALGGNGASVHLVDASGNVAFRALFATDAEGIAEALGALRSGPGGHPFARERRLVPALRGLARCDDVVRAAGPAAVEDLRREAPLVYGAAELAWVWRTLTPLGRVALVAAGAAALGALFAGGRAISRRRER
jgi:hypothetical protein